MLFIISCNEKTPQEKLEEAIEEDPDFLIKLEKSINTQAKANIILDLKETDIPPSIKERVGGTNVFYTSMDLDKDSRREIIALADSLDKVKLHIIKLGLNHQLYHLSTHWITEPDTTKHSFSSKFGLLEWTRDIRKRNETINQKILIRFEAAKNNLCMVQLDEERIWIDDEKETKILSIKSNFITSKLVANCKSKSSGKHINESESSMELDVQLPTLFEIDERLLDYEKPYCQ